MKKVLYWLMGDKAGRTIVGAWNWMWALPVESGGGSGGGGSRRVAAIDARISAKASSSSLHPSCRLPARQNEI